MEIVDKRRQPLESFYELVQTLRMSAAAKYEMEKAKGTPDGEIATKLDPLMTQLELAQQEAAHHNFDGVGHAVIQLELDAQAFDDHAEYLKRKASDCRAHGDKLRRLLQADMEQKGEHTRRGLFHSAALVEVIDKGGSKRKNLVVR